MPMPTRALPMSISPHLLVDQFLGKCLPRIAFKFCHWNISPRTHGAGRLGIGRIDPNRILRPGRRAEREEKDRRKAPGERFHDRLAVCEPMHARTSRRAKLPQSPETALAGD